MIFALDTISGLQYVLGSHSILGVGSSEIIFRYVHTHKLNCDYIPRLLACVFSDRISAKRLQTSFIGL